MNANTRLRLWKETRALLPMWLAPAAWVSFPFLLPIGDPLTWSFAGFLFGCAVLGPVCVGHEFAHGTMGALLAQPVPRRKLWWEKLAVTSAALLSLSLLFLGLIEVTGNWHRIFDYDAEGEPSPMALLIMLIPLLGFCTGPALTLFVRNSLGGAALTFIYPFFLQIAGLLLVANMGELLRDVEEQFLLSYVLLVGGSYAGGVFLWGCRRFERLEDVNLLAQEISAPRQFTALFSGLTRHLTPAQHGPTLNLLRKELRLQQPAFLVAQFLIVLWVTFVGVWRVRPTVGGEIMLIPVIFLCLAIPVMVGIVSTAEERRLGVHEWHLTLPVSARRLWTVKLLVALGVNAVLGLLLPGLLAHASSWLANDPKLIAEIPGRNVPPFLIANLVLVGAALYASSVSANSMRALVGTIVLFIVAGLFLPTSAEVHVWLSGLIDQQRSMPPNATYDSWFRFEFYYWPLGWVCLAGWLYSLGMVNFRSSLASLSRPVGELAGLFMVAWLFTNVGWNGPTLLVLFFQRVGW